LTRRGSRLHPASAAASAISSHAAAGDARRRRSIGSGPEGERIVAEPGVRPGPRRLAARFGGADRFILLIDRELRRAGATGFQAALGVELAGRLDRPRLARAFDAVRRDHPRAGARLVPASWLRDWRLTADRAALARDALAWSSAHGEAAGGLAPFVAARVNAPLDPRRDPLFDLAVREIAGEGAAARTLLVLRWWHPACDERGAELLLRELSQAYSGAAGRARADGTVDGASAGFVERRAAFRRARRRLEELTAATPHSLARPAARAGPFDWNFERTLLDATATTAWLARAEREFGARSEGLAQLALVARALAADAPAAAEVALPLTVQLRPPRARAPVLANELSFLWYSFAAAAVRDETRFAPALLATARAKVAGGEERDARVLLDEARRMPLTLYRRELLRRDGSTRFSASLSTLGEILSGVQELFGVPLKDSIALTVFPSPPGIGFIFSRALGRLAFTTCAWNRDVAPAAAAAIHARIATALHCS
jgi:hypothetical protein